MPLSAYSTRAARSSARSSAEALGQPRCSTRAVSSRDGRAPTAGGGEHAHDLETDALHRSGLRVVRPGVARREHRQQDLEGLEGWQAAREPEQASSTRGAVRAAGPRVAARARSPAQSSAATCSRVQVTARLDDVLAPVVEPPVANHRQARLDRRQPLMERLLGGAHRVAALLLALLEQPDVLGEVAAPPRAGLGTRAHQAAAHIGVERREGDPELACGLGRGKIVGHGRLLAWIEQSNQC